MTMTDALVDTALGEGASVGLVLNTSKPPRIADRAARTTLGTVSNIFRLIAEGLEGASAARARYPLAD